VLEEQRGRPDEARLNYEQAAAYYPRQAERLQDLLDPYRARAFLRKTREGNHVLGLYRSMMAGAGPFSPDLRLATLAYAAGDEARGRAKVLDHFARRRGDRAWAVLLPDVRFAERALGPYFDRLFPEDTFLDLVADRTLFRDKLGVKIDNRSDRTLHNATLVLCVHLTDMHPDDCEAMAPPTQPIVLPHTTTTFDALAIDVDFGGQKKTVDDVVSVRAALIADETVAWVDTAQARIDAARALHDGSSVTPSAASTTASTTASAAAGGEQAGGEESERATWQRVTGLSPDVVEQLVRRGLAAAIEAGLGDDEVSVRLPRELAILHPSIRLRHDGRDFASATSSIDDGVIRLRFDDVGDLESATSAQDFELQIATRFFTVTAALGKGTGGRLALRDVRVTDAP
jgi:hypothetical protein